jgi:glycerol uptake facilitator-like aquaporin
LTLGLARRLAAEGAGTFFLVATVVGTGLMGPRMTSDIGLQLLANAAATAAMLGVLISLLAPISGAHFNPAVSLVMCLRGVLSWSELAPYALAQVAGGILGTLIAHAMFGEPLLQVSTQVRAGLPLGVSEVVAGFGLVSVVLLGGARTPVLVAAYIGAAYWFTASTSFANPAVTIARMLTDSFAGIRPLDGAVFIAAQLAGAILAWAAVGWLTSKGPERNPGPEAQMGSLSGSDRDPS